MSVVDAMSLLLQYRQKRFSLIDVGARWGANQRWMQLGAGADILCFEPDAEECTRLNAMRPPHVRYLPYGLADSPGMRDLHVTAEPACSSLHPPIPALFQHYPPLTVMQPDRVVSVQCRRLDDVLIEEGIEDVAAIKLDTQGSELAILRGGIEALKACCLIDIEVELNPLYQGQALFCDVDRFLRDHGFVLWRLENLVHYAPEAIPAATSGFLLSAEPSAAVVAVVPNGQVFWAQAQYVRATYPRTGSDWLPMKEACHAATLVGMYGFWDLALELVRKTGNKALLSALRRTLDLS